MSAASVSKQSESHQSESQEGRTHSHTPSRPGRKQHVWEHVNPAMLESWRTMHDMSSKQAATRLGVSLSCYYNWLRGQNVPTPTRQVELRRVIEASPAADMLDPQAASQASGRHCKTGTSLVDVAGPVVAIFQSLMTAQPNALRPAEVPGFLREVRDALTD